MERRDFLATAAQEAVKPNEIFQFFSVLLPTMLEARERKW